MKILLTHGYFLMEDPAEQQVMKPYPPIGILCLSAYLTSNGIEHEVFDSTFSSSEAQWDYLVSINPDVIGFYVNLMTRKNILSLIRRMKASDQFNHTRIMIGGPDARFHAGGYLSEGVDVVVPGEGERAVCEILGQWMKDGQTDTVKGIIFSHEGEILNTGDPVLLDPSELPVPDREKIDLEPYFSHWRSRHGYSSVTVNTMRGCPYDCKWCSKSVFGKRYRRRSPESVVQELITIREKYYPDQVWFTDDVFTISVEWLKSFADELQERSIIIPYECISRSDCLDEETLDLLRQTGCRKLWIGAESGSQRMIDKMSRRINVEETVRVIRLAKEMGIETGTFIMTGYPGEKKDDIFKTGEFLRKANPDEMTLGMAYPIRGTDLFLETEPSFILPYDWKMVNEREIQIPKPFSNLFYRFAWHYLFSMYRHRFAEALISKIILKIIR